MRDEQLLRYSRHIMLPEIDISGQLKLLESHILVVGAGGLGCPAALYLASSGVGTLSISDDDRVDLANLQRQIGHHVADIGTKKTISLKNKIKAINPDTRVHLLPALQGNNLQKNIDMADIVLDCTDNFNARCLLNSHCVIQKKRLVSGTVAGFTGQLGVFATNHGTACYQCLYPDLNNLPAASCAESGVIAPAAGVIGTLQALEALKLIISAGRTLEGTLLTFNALEGKFNSFGISRDEHCPVCAVTDEGSKR